MSWWKSILATALVIAVAFGTWQAGSAMMDDHRAAPLRAQLLGTLRGGEAEDLKATGQHDGGVKLTGKLAGRAFAVFVPRQWNNELILFAHGYTIPGTPATVPSALSKSYLSQASMALYDQGYAIAFAAYDKGGFGVESGAKNTLRLREYLRHLQPTRTYVWWACRWEGRLQRPCLSR